jgi:endonuclease/exonuclease/phosphatase family metal-dependent hydrolase
MKNMRSLPTWRFYGIVALPLLIVAIGRAEPPLRVRVLSYNIHHGEGQDYVVDLERIARVIESVDPDLVALQEVDCNVRRTDLLDQPAELARLTKMHFVFGHNIPHEGGLYGNAVLSRWPIVRSENHRLPTCYVGEQRGVLEVAVQPPGRKGPLLLLATHFDDRPQSAERRLSARMVNDLIATRGGVPALLVGDLNDTTESFTIGELDKLWRRANLSHAATYPVGFPYKQIDYVMVYPRTKWRVIEARVLDERIASDHRPFLVVLEL